LSVVSVS